MKPGTHHAILASAEQLLIDMDSKFQILPCIICDTRRSKSQAICLHTFGECCLIPVSFLWFPWNDMSHRDILETGFMIGTRY